MMSVTRRFGLAVAVMGLMAGQASAGQVITFDDLTTRTSFFDQGIASSYQGFEWGYSNTPGPTGAVIPTSSQTGWASATVSDPAVGPAPTPVSGNSYAWNWNGAQSLFIDFQNPLDVTGGYFSTLSSAYSSNASTIQLFGYDAGDNLLGSSSILGLTNSFQYLAANLIGVTKLEIRANADSRWFSVDDLQLGVAAVPEPSTLISGGVAGIFGLGLAWRNRRRKLAAFA